jgi:hypothetical protein
MDDLRADLLRKPRHGLDVRAAPGPQAEVVEPRAQLIEGPTVPARGRPTHQNACAAADAVEGVRGPDQRVHVAEVAELLPERQTARRVVDGELDMGDTIQCDTHKVSWVVSWKEVLTLPPRS